MAPPRPPSGGAAVASIRARSDRSGCRGCRRAPGSRCGAAAARIFLLKHPPPQNLYPLLVAKAVARFAAATGKALARLLVVAGHAQALAAAAGAGLDHHRVADAAGDLPRP